MSEEKNPSVWTVVEIASLEDPYVENNVMLTCFHLAKVKGGVETGKQTLVERNKFQVGEKVLFHHLQVPPVRQEKIRNDGFIQKINEGSKYLECEAGTVVQWSV